MDQKELLKVANALCKDFEHYRHHLYEKDEKELEQRLNEHIEEFGKDNLTFRMLNWFLGVYRNTLKIEECSKKLTAKNAENFKQMYPNSYSKQQLLIDDKSVAKRLGLSENTIKIKKSAIFKEIIEMQNMSH